MKILDTDVLVGALRGDPRAEAAVLTAGADGLTTTLNAAELLEGAALARQPDAEREAVEELLRQLKLIPFGPKAARRYGPLAADLQRAGHYPGLMDVLIAAIALTEDATFVTRNRRHFEHIPGLVLEAW